MELRDHDLLLRIDERVQNIEECLTAHLKQHWAVLLMVITVFVGVVVTVACTVR